MDILDFSLPANHPAFIEVSRLLNELHRHMGIRLSNDDLFVVVCGASLFLSILLWRMLRTGLRIDRAVFRQKKRGGYAGVGKIKDILAAYLRSVFKTFLEGVVLFCVVAVVMTLLYGLCKIAWYSYLVGPVGQYYKHYFPHRVQLMEMGLGRDIFFFPTLLTGLALVSGIVFAACCRVFYITRYLYIPRGIFGRIVLFGFSSNLLTAVAARWFFSIPHWGVAYVSTLIPTLLVFSHCFRFATRILPEIGLCFTFWKRKKRPPLHVLFLSDTHKQKKVHEFDPLNGLLTGRTFSVNDQLDIRGLYFLKGRHVFIFYRYGHDLFFQVDDWEIPLYSDMTVKLEKKGRYGRRFEFYRDGARLFRLAWSSFPNIASRSPALVFFEAISEFMQSPSAYNQAFMAKDPESFEDHDFLNTIPF